MSVLFKKIQTALKHKTTYRSGLLQAKAYRILKQSTAEALASRDVSTIEWALLGLLYDESEGLYLHEAASELGVEPPFVTAIAHKLIKRGFVSKERCDDDSRAKVICLTSKGTTFVKETETYLRNSMRGLFADVSYGDIATYLLVLQKIIENAPRR